MNYNVAERMRVLASGNFRTVNPFGLRSIVVITEQGNQDIEYLASQLQGILRKRVAIEWKSWGHAILHLLETPYESRS